MPLEGVVHALHNIRAALVPGGVVLDSQPVSARPPIESEAGALGTLNMTEWAALIEDVDRRLAQVLDDGLFVVEDESRFTVTDEYDDGSDFLTYVRDWAGTRVEPDVERRVARERGRVRLHEEIRLRVLRVPGGP